MDTENLTRDSMIANAGTHGRITFMIRQYGRGSDFVCHSAQIISKGGVGVILTFFPSTLAEEKQIKGRTCRQNDPGSIDIILYLPDLTQNFEIRSLNEMGSSNNYYSYIVHKRNAMNAQSDQNTMQRENKVISYLKDYYSI